ncbi:peptidyl-tRNA hydrolase [Nonomuraea fuscirosea]|uniref:peptidyl-tRNA hydrolase n=1 Tax=Nonomuraea fuscirosea TaxID=1291556 RepID=A0A2T0MDR1_9ACTN|nr:peptidyl-tRNA hydrolase [Nonomuraea fuscirosea]PRX55636.1 peptidyl-tRNA hydrolase [Nonomuraea fuscirosea]
MNAELYVLPLVVRIERAARHTSPGTDPHAGPTPGPDTGLATGPRVGPRQGPPERTDALEAAAMAVLSLLDDPGEWTGELHAWQSTGKIRKVVRRARGAEWRRALALPGRTIEHRTAEVRVHPPVPLDDWPRDLARLQVSGTELTDTAAPGPAEPPILWANPALEMSAGKAMAQAGHAAQLAWWASDAGERAAWRERGLAVSVRTAGTQEDFDSLVAAGLPVVRDAGFTEIDPGSCTFVADAPWLYGRVSSGGA